MSKYYIDYETGAGNQYVDGDLEEAKKIADLGAAYTQCDIGIYTADKKGKVFEYICGRQWWGVKFDPGDYEGENPDIISFGDFGYFDEWVEEFK